MNRITTHPGDVLKEELEARGISQKKFSEVLNVPYTQLNEILNGCKDEAFKAKALKDFGRMTFNDDNAFNEYVTKNVEKWQYESSVADVEFKYDGYDAEGYPVGEAENKD